MVCYKTFRSDIVCPPNLVLLYSLTYKSDEATFDNLQCLVKLSAFEYTRFIKAKFITDSYQCSLFHLHEIHLCTCSYMIPWYCYKQHYHYSCVLFWHTRLYLKQQKESNRKTFN